MTSKSALPTIEEPAVDSPEAETALPELKKKELIEAIVARSDLRKGMTRQAVEASFDVIREALEAGRELNIPPLGKVKINKMRTNDSGDKIIVAKLRLSSNNPGDDADGGDAPTLETDASEAE